MALAAELHASSLPVYYMGKLSLIAMINHAIMKFFITTIELLCVMVARCLYNNDEAIAFWTAIFSIKPFTPLLFLLLGSPHCIGKSHPVFVNKLVKIICLFLPLPGSLISLLPSRFLQQNGIHYNVFHLMCNVFCITRHFTTQSLSSKNVQSIR